MPGLRLGCIAAVFADDRGAADRSLVRGLRRVRAVADFVVDVPGLVRRRELGRGGAGVRILDVGAGAARRAGRVRISAAQESSVRLSRPLVGVCHAGPPWLMCKTNNIKKAGFCQR